jgi:hypothetical protein
MIRGLLPSCCLATIGGTYTDTHRQQGDIISLLLFLQHKESRLEKKVMMVVDTYEDFGKPRILHFLKISLELYRCNNLLSSWNWRSHNLIETNEKRRQTGEKFMREN